MSSGIETRAPTRVRLVQSSALVAVGTLLSRITGVLRVGALAFALGVTDLSDVYQLANTTPNLIYELVLGGVLSATLVPVFLDHLERDDPDGVSAVLSVTAIVLVGLTTIAVIGAPWILRLYLVLRDDDLEQVAEVGVPLMRFFLPQILFYGFTTLGTALLHARRQFGIPAYAPVLNNIVVTVMLVASKPIADRSLDVDSTTGDLGILALLGLGTTAGVVVMTLVLVPAIRKSGVPLRWNPDWRNSAVRSVARLSGWTVGYVVANQIALVVVQALALAEPGQLATYQFAFVFFQLPHGLVAVSVMTTFLPELAAAANRVDFSAFRQRFGYGLRLIAVLVAPAAAGYAVLSTTLVRALLEQGEFSGDATTATANTIVAFAPGILGFSAYLFAIRGFYALKDTRTPFFLNCIENAINIVAAVALWNMKDHDAAALAAAYSFAYLVAGALALRELGRRIGGLESLHTVRAVATSLVAAGVMAAVVSLLPVPEGGERAIAVDVMALAGAALAGAAVYCVTLVGLGALAADRSRRPID